MSTIATNYYVVNTLAASGADATVVAGGLVSISNGTSTVPVCRYEDIVQGSYSKVSGTAGTPGTAVVPFPTAAAGDAYKLVMVSCNSVTGQFSTTTVRYTATGTLTATNLGAAMVAATPSTASPFNARVTGLNSTGTVTWTAVAGWEQIVSAILVVKPAGSTSAVTLTVGMSSKGTVAELASVGLTATGILYDKYSFHYVIPSTSGNAPAMLARNVYYFNAAAGTNYTNLTARMTYIAGADSTYTGITANIANLA